MNDTVKPKSEIVALTGTQINVPPELISGSSVAGAALTVILVALALRKRLSKDNLELTKDRAETNLIATYQETIKSLQEQNEKLDANAREAWRTRAEDAKRIGELSSKVEHLTDINESLEKTVGTMQTRIDHLLSMVRRLLPPEDRLHFDALGQIPTHLTLENQHASTHRQNPAP